MKALYLIVCAMAVGCAAHQSTVPVVDLNPDHAAQVFVASSKAQSEVITPPVTLWKISWQIISDNTNMPQDNVEFDVDKCDNLENPDWQLFCRTNQPPVFFTSDGVQGYFRVGAHFINP